MRQKTVEYYELQIHKNRQKKAMQISHTYLINSQCTARTGKCIRIRGRNTWIWKTVHTTTHLLSHSHPLTHLPIIDMWKNTNTDAVTATNIQPHNPHRKGKSPINPPRVGRKWRKAKGGSRYDTNQTNTNPKPIINYLYEWVYDWFKYLN